jgi:hypothetical protein
MSNLQYYCKVLTQKLKRTNCLAKLKDLEEEKRKNNNSKTIIAKEYRDGLKYQSERVQYGDSVQLKVTGFDMTT